MRVATPWSPTSWRSKPARQQPVYPDPTALQRAVDHVAALPPLVTSWEVERLKSQLAEAGQGKRFILQGGDCSERFADCQSELIASQLKVLLKVSLVLAYALRRPLVRVGRFAGQYAKPRSADTETRGDVTLPVYRGDLINGSAFTAEERTPDPERLIRGYERAGLTLNFVRGLVDGGFADLHHPELWNLEFVRHSGQPEEYLRITNAVAGAVHFLESMAERRLDELRRVDFFASHEGLLLPYEQAQTRQVPRRTGWYNLSTHFPWIGERTRQIDGAHVEYFRGIANPLGVKVGPTISPEELLALVDILNPDDEPGRLTLIHRFGTDKIEECLPPLVECILSAGRSVVWICDPMHGNTIGTASGKKTRSFDHILAELGRAFDIHTRVGSVLGGVHFELTGENVTECIGGARGLCEADLSRAYQSEVDPRLNYEQSLELALLIARRMS